MDEFPAGLSSLLGWVIVGSTLAIVIIVVAVIFKGG